MYTYLTNTVLLYLEVNIAFSSSELRFHAHLTQNRCFVYIYIALTWYELAFTGCFMQLDSGGSSEMVENRTQFH